MLAATLLIAITVMQTLAEATIGIPRDQLRSSGQSRLRLQQPQMLALIARDQQRMSLLSLPHYCISRSLLISSRSAYDHARPVNWDPSHAGLCTHAVLCGK